MIFNVAKRAYGILPSSWRAKSPRLFVAQLTLALLDFFSLAAFLPLLMLLINPDVIETNEIVKSVYETFSFKSHSSFVIAFSLALVLFIFIKSLVSVWLTRWRASFAYGAASDLASDLMQDVLNRSYTNFSAADFGFEQTRLTSHPFAFANNIVLPLSGLVTEILVVGMILVAVGIYNPMVAVFMLIIIVPSLLIIAFRRKKQLSINSSLRKQFPVLNKFSSETLSGFTDIKAFAKSSFFLRRFNSVVNDITKTFIKEQTLQASGLRMAEMVMALLVATLVIYSVSTQQSARETAMMIGVYAAAIFRMIPSVSRINTALQQIRIYEFLLDEIHEFKEKSTPDTKHALVPFQKSLTVGNLSFGYNPDSPILNHVSFSVDKGQKVCVTGPSGGGKSTLLMILLGLIHENGGLILVDGVELDFNRRKDLMGFVPQDPMLLNDTIARNIAFGIPDEEIDRKKVHEILGQLRLNEFVTHLADGIDHVIGENGMMLSGGQRQRIAVGRVLYRNAQILLLDEATNQLDRQLETEVLEILRNLPGNITIIMVSHHNVYGDFFDAVYSLNDRVPSA